MSYCKHILGLLLLPAILGAEPPQDQYVQLFYRTDINDNHAEADIHALRMAAPQDICLHSGCVLSIYHGPFDKGHDLRRFNLYVPLPGPPITTTKKAKSGTVILRPGDHRRHTLGKLHLLFYSLPDCSHESTALLNQIYRSQPDADLFVVFLPEPEEQSCIQFKRAENPYHSLSDPPEAQTARTLLFSRGSHFRFFRDERGMYHCSASDAMLARLRLHFRGRQLLGLEVTKAP